MFSNKDIFVSFNMSALFICVRVYVFLSVNRTLNLFSCKILCLNIINVASLIEFQIYALLILKSCRRMLGKGSLLPLSHLFL